MKNISTKKCKPCEGGVKPLSLKECKVLLSKLNGWKLEKGKKLEKNFEFKDFKSAMAFVNKVAKLAEKEGHHPDILIYQWNKVRIEIFTHSIKGLSENDFILASKIDKIKS